MIASAIGARDPPSRTDANVQRIARPQPFIITQTLQQQEIIMRITFINNDGGGFADYVEVEPGMTVSQFFAQQMPHGRPEDYLIRVNRQPVPADYALQEGDRVSATPTKIEGAADC